MKKPLTLFALFFFAHSAAAVDLQAAADDVCKCLEAPYKMVEESMQELAKAQASGDYSKLMEAQGNAMGIVNSSTQCFEDLPRKYPEVNADDKLKNAVMKEVDKKCPNPADKYRKQFGPGG